MAQNAPARGAARAAFKTKRTDAAGRAATFRDTVEQERAARDAKNVKLRALRLEKEARDQDEAIVNAALKASAPKRKSRARPKKV